MLALATLLVALQQPAPPPASPPAPPGAWVVHPAEAYMLDTAGRATDPAGATVTLRAIGEAPPGSSGSALATVPADAFRLRRVRLSGEVSTTDADGAGASLTLRVEGAAGPLYADNGAGQAVRGTAAWTPRAVTVVVTPDATRLVLGVVLQGGGEAAVRNLRLEALPEPPPNAPVAPAAARVLDSAFAIVRRGSMWRDTVSWGKVEREVRAYARGAGEPADVYPAIRVLLARLGDHHSTVLPPQQSAAWRGGGAQNPDPEVRTLGDSVGYVAVPTYGGADPAAGRAYAVRLHALLQGAMTGARCGWIVDLRRNGGGNMWPMLAGLKPFLGDAPLGSFQGPSGPSPAWRAGVGLGPGAPIESPRELGALERAPVAVLTGPRTASSGEAVTVAFRGRARTRSFGLATAGLSNANADFPLPDGGIIFLTVAVDADRTGKRYGWTIPPDQPVEGGGQPPAPNAPALGADPAVTAATAWLASQTQCRAGR